MKGRECDLMLQLKGVFYVLKAQTAGLFKVSSRSLQILTWLLVFHFDLDQSTKPLLIPEAGYTDNSFFCIFYSVRHSEFIPGSFVNIQSCYLLRNISSFKLTGLSDTPAC